MYLNNNFSTVLPVLGRLVDVVHVQHLLRRLGRPETREDVHQRRAGRGGLRGTHHGDAVLRRTVLPTMDRLDRLLCLQRLLRRRSEVAQEELRRRARQRAQQLPGYLGRRRVL